MIGAIAVLLAALPSLVAPVVPLAVNDPAAVGVPVTEHEMVAPGATVAGGAGMQFALRPAGRPLIAQAALVAAIAGALALVQV